MRLKLLAIPLSFVFLIGMISMNGSAPAYATTSMECAASLDGTQEVPPVDTEGTGSATMEFDPSSNELSWSIEFTGLSGAATAAHFHGPAAEGTNAGVLVGIGDVSGLASPMIGSAMLTSEQATFLLDGDLYINIHTGMHPDGEIRGQVSCDSAPSTPSEETSTAPVVIGEDEFDIQYTITGATLDEVTADPATQTLLFAITSTSNGTLTVWLPSNVIDADDEFSVFVDDEFGNFVVNELNETTDARVLEIEFESGAEEIEVVGTFMAGGEEPGPAPQTIAVEIGGQTYQVSYDITGGSVQGISSDIESKSLIVAITATSNGTLTVWLPTNVIDADDEFTVFVDGGAASFTELDETTEARVLEIEFESGATEIEIVGTFIVPEFGAITILVASIAIVGTIIATTRFHKFGGLRP
jgi:hypothetical protein